MPAWSLTGARGAGATTPSSAVRSNGRKRRLRRSSRARVVSPCVRQSVAATEGARYHLIRRCHSALEEVLRRQRRRLALLWIFDGLQHVAPRELVPRVSHP